MFVSPQAIIAADDSGQEEDFLPSDLTSDESQLCLYISAHLSAAKNAHFAGKIMEKPNVVVIGYAFADRCFHAYLVGLASDQIQRDLGVVSPTCQPTAHA